MWQCPECQTEIDDEMSVCWNCGTSKKGVRDPNFVKADDYEPPREEPQSGQFRLISLLLVTFFVAAVLAIARISPTAGIYLVGALILLLSIPWVVAGLRWFL